MSDSKQAPGVDSGLDSLRKKIDVLDEQIQTLVNERAQCARKVAEHKVALSTDDPQYYRPEREVRILDAIVRRNTGPLSDEALSFLFREIMSACRASETPLAIAYLGPQGTFTQEAALRHFGHAVDTLPMATIDGVFREVEAGKAHYGVVPIENTTEGIVNHTLDQLIHSPLQICGEVDLRVHHHLMSLAGNMEAIKFVYTHSQTLAQCRLWLTKKLPYVECQAVSSNAEAARLAAKQQDVAAIAGASAAEIYKLSVLASNIEDHPNNTTRFLIIGERSPSSSSVADKTSLLVSAQNKPGALYDLLKPLADNGISMTRIESRPSRQGMWEYVFFIDIEGHQNESTVASALAQLRESAAVFKILGSYPKAVL